MLQYNIILMHAAKKAPASGRTEVGNIKIDYEGRNWLHQVRMSYRNKS
jgi:hypothetical protein